MELVDPAVDFVGLARSFGVHAERAKTVHEATDLIAKGLESNTSLLIDVALDRAFKPM
jgi:benzoylformate decarboxylase